MTSPLIYVPRKTTSDVDFAPPMKSIIQRVYGESPDQYAEPISQLNRARQDALRGTAGSESTARDLLFKYFGQLELLELRFPDLRVPFPWNDAFTSTRISQSSIAYEKASVIFNMGATLSALASASPRSSPEGLKRAYNSFKQAAGMFMYINDNFLHAPSTDLSRDVVKLLVVIMKAQATEVFIETMGPVSPKNANLRSKLYIQVASAYSSILEEVKEQVNKATFPRDWSILIQAKAKHFGSLAQYTKSMADSAANSHGDALSRLQQAESMAKEGYKIAQLFSASFASAGTSLPADAATSFLELTKAHQTLMTEVLNRAQKENDLVYSAVITSVAALPAIDKGKEVAEPTAIHDIYAQPDVQKIVGPDLFNKLVPLAVHESASLYSEEKAKLARAETERAELADVEMNAALEYMGLPRSLDRFKAGGSNGDEGPQIREWATNVRSAEREEPLTSLLSTRDSLRAKATASLDKAASLLDTESRACEALRVKYGHLWEQAPSASLTRTMRTDIKSHRESLSTASQADERAVSMWKGVQSSLALLIDQSKLEQAFRPASGQSLLDTEDDDTDAKVKEIQNLLGKLNKIKKERNDMLKDLKEKIQNDDISQLLVLNRKPGSAEQIFAAELEKFRPQQSRITQTLQAQASTLSEISSLFQALNDTPKAKELASTWVSDEKKRRDLQANLSQAHETYHQVRDGTKRGIAFYTELRDLAQSLEDQAQDFVRRRDRERTEMEGEAATRQRLEGNSTGPSSTTTGLEYGMSNMNVSSRNEYPSSYSSPAPPPSLHYQSPPPPTQSPYSPPPPPPSSAPQHQGYTQPQQAYAYGDIPSSGAFSLGSSSQTPSYHQPPQQPAHNSYSPAYSSHSQPPPVSSPSSGYYQPRPGGATNQSPLPPPPSQHQPSYSYNPHQAPSSPSSYLPPPPDPLSYSSGYSTGQPRSPYSPQAPPTGGMPPPRPPPPPGQPPYGYR